MKIQLPNEVISKDYEERNMCDIHLWMVKEFKVNRSTKVIQDDTISEHIDRVLELTKEGKRVGLKFDGLSVHKVDEYVIERLLRGYYQELLAKKVIIIQKLMQEPLRRIVIKMNAKIKRELADES